MGTGSFPGVKRPGRVFEHPPSSIAEVKERVQLYLYSSSGPSWPVLGRTLPLPLPLSTFPKCNVWVFRPKSSALVQRLQNATPSFVSSIRLSLSVLANGTERLAGMDFFFGKFVFQTFDTKFATHSDFG
jgi:hypothetical protein